MPNTSDSPNVRMRRKTAAQWSAQNPILMLGQFGLETDTMKMKLGNGTDAWADLGYMDMDESDDASGGSLRYLARLAQAGANAPTATVKRNTLGLGTPTFGYIGDGIYQVLLEGLSLETHSAQVIINKDVPCTVITLFNEVNYFFIQAWDGTGTNADGIVNDALLIIEAL